MAVATYSTATSGSNLYITGGSGTTGTWTNTSISTTGTAASTLTMNDVLAAQELLERQARPLRIAQRQKLSAMAYRPEDMLSPIEPVDFGVVEIPAHRVARGLKWYEVQENTVLELPDGTILDVEDAYRWKLYEDNAKVTREACRIQGFNRFLNASELLSAFIKDMAPHGIRQDQVLKVPVEAFINWLVYRAAEADGDVPPSTRWNHRCGYCKKFLAKRLVSQGVNFCNASHLDGYLQRIEMPLLEKHG